MAIVCRVRILEINLFCGAHKPVVHAEPYPFGVIRAEFGDLLVAALGPPLAYRFFAAVLDMVIQDTRIFIEEPVELHFTSFSVVEPERFHLKFRHHPAYIFRRQPDHPQP
jgi:hypothetical protein